MVCLDLSQYDISTFDADCFKAAGVDEVILGVYHPAGPERMAAVAAACQLAGIRIKAFYGLPYFGSTFGENRDIDWAIDLAHRFGVSQVYIDCEIDAAPFGFTDDVGATVARRVSVIQTLVNRIELNGLEAGIYTAGWWWRPNTNNSDLFSHLPLWFANYGINDGTQPPFIFLPDPFGDWTMPTIHQFTSLYNVCGRGRDANYVLKEDTMTSPEDKEVLDALVSIFGGREQVLEKAAAGMDYLLGYAIEQADQNQLEAAVAALQAATGVSKEAVTAAAEAAIEAFKSSLSAS